MGHPKCSVWRLVFGVGVPGHGANGLATNVVEWSETKEEMNEVVCRTRELPERRKEEEKV